MDKRNLIDINRLSIDIVHGINMMFGKLKHFYDINVMYNKYTLRHAHDFANGIVT